MQSDRFESTFRAFHLVDQGMSSREALRRVNALGLRTDTGKPVSSSTFSSNLRNPLYKGLINVPRYQVRVKGDFEPLIPPETFDRVQQILNGGQRRKSHTWDHPDFPLRRFVTCANCGTSYTGSKVKEKYFYYFCPNPDCECSTIRKERLEELFVSHLESLQPKPEYVVLFREIVEGRWRERSKEVRQARKDLQKRMEEIQSKLDKLFTACIYEERIDDALYHRQRGLLDREMLQVRMELTELWTEELDLEAVLAYSENFLLDLARLWKDGSPDHRLRLQKATFPEGIPFDGVNFKTAPISFAFRLLEQIPNRQKDLVAPTGFEPVF